MKTTHRFLSLSSLLASAVLVLLTAASGCASKAPTELNAQDVAWALDQQIWKIDYGRVDPLFGFRVVVLDDKQNVIKSSGILGGNAPLSKSDGSSVARVSCQKRGATVAGKFSISGASQNYEFEGLFAVDTWSRVGRPALNGNFYHLAADSDVVGTGQAPFGKGCHVLALEILREAKHGGAD